MYDETMHSVWKDPRKFKAKGGMSGDRGLEWSAVAAAAVFEAEIEM
jgi:hypothetical protein